MTVLSQHTCSGDWNFGPMRNEYEGGDDSTLPSKKILVGPKLRAENSLGRNSCNPQKKI